MPDKRAPDPDEELDLDVPPLDGGTDEPDGDDADPRGLDELDDVATRDTDGTDPFDDSTGEDDPVEDIEEEERSWLTDAEPAESAIDVDLGELAGDREGTSGGGSLLSDVDEPGVGDEDFDLGGEDDEGLDAGDEGPTGPDEEMREEDLPQLDADEEEDIDGAALFELALDEDPETPLPWDRARWTPAGTALDVGPTVAVACSARDVLALVEPEDGAGRRALVRVDLEGCATELAAQGAPRRSETLVVEPDAVWLEEAGRRYVSRDGGGTFQPSTRESEAAAPGGAAGRAPATVPVTPRVEGVREAAITAGPDGSTLAALVSTRNGRTWVASFEGGGSGTIVAELDRMLEESGSGGGRRWSASDAADIEVRVMAWDAARGVVWIAGSFGVLALQPPPRALRGGEGGS